MAYNAEETKRRGYSGRSKVYFDGREWLRGIDWKRRKEELWKRADGRCEQVTSDGVRCKSEGHDPHHVRSRWKKHDDRLENLQLLCRLHHDLKDQRKIGGRR